jgi:hypothetical protein
VEFRILGPLELLENGHQVVRHRTGALRARPARLARFIEEQRAPPGSTTFAPGRPAAHLGKFGDRVRGRPAFAGLFRARLVRQDLDTPTTERFRRPRTGR